MVLTFFLNLLLAIIGIILGGIVLFFGRRALGVTLAIIVLAVSANVLAILVAGASAGRDLVTGGQWLLVAAAIALGTLGFAAGRYRPELATSLIGIIAGAGIALWLYDVAAYVMTSVANLPEGTAIVVGVVLLAIGGALGYWLVQVQPDEALILITTLIAAELIHDALNLSRTSSWTAIIVLGLGLAGVLVQFADYLRELKAANALDEPEPVASSVAYFQDLQLDN